VIALVVLAAVVALGCALASSRRLYFASNALVLHPAVWLSAIERGEGDRAERAAKKNPRADWERDVIDASRDADENSRTARINELLIDLDFRIGRWERVPRVCASIASSAGFLFGSLTLRFGLVASSALTEDLRSDAINAVVLQAVNVAALGVAGAAFAIAAQVHARRVAKAFHRDVDALVATLEKAA
jgi:hypothetical protein